MYLLIDTSTSECRMSGICGDIRTDRVWDEGRTMARNVLRRVDEMLEVMDTTYGGLEGIGVFRGPGSFTGLRIGITVANTIASAQSIPVVGASGDDWQLHVIDRLRAGDNDRIVLPEYGSGARITKPRK